MTTKEEVKIKSPETYAEKMISKEEPDALGYFIRKFHRSSVEYGDLYDRGNLEYYCDTWEDYEEAYEMGIIYGTDILYCIEVDKLIYAIKSIMEDDEIGHLEDHKKALEYYATYSGYTIYL